MDWIPRDCSPNLKIIIHHFYLNVKGKIKKMKRLIKEDSIANGDCSFCGSHEDLDNYSRVIKKFLYGYEDERGSFIFVNDCGDYSYICRKCWGRIKRQYTKKRG